MQKIFQFYQTKNTAQNTAPGALELRHSLLILHTFLSVLVDDLTIPFVEENNL